MTKVMIALTGLGLMLLGAQAKADDDPEPPPPGPIGVRLVAKKTTFELDRGGLSKAEYLEAIQSRRAPRVPVELELVVINRTRNLIRVQTAGNKVNQWLAGWSLTLKGKGAVSGGPYWSDKKDQRPARFVVLAPGAKTTIPITGLMSHMASTQVRNHHWTEPGTYSLSASLFVPVELDWDEGKPSTAKTLKLITGPIKLTVEK